VPITLEIRGKGSDEGYFVGPVENYPGSVLVNYWEKPTGTIWYDTIIEFKWTEKLTMCYLSLDKVNRKKNINEEIKTYKRQCPVSPVWLITATIHNNPQRRQIVAPGTINTRHYGLWVDVIK